MRSGSVRAWVIAVAAFGAGCSASGGASGDGTRDSSSGSPSISERGGAASTTGGAPGAAAGAAPAAAGYGGSLGAAGSAAANASAGSSGLAGAGGGSGGSSAEGGGFAFGGGGGVPSSGGVPSGGNGGVAGSNAAGTGTGGVSGGSGSGTSAGGTSAGGTSGGGTSGGGASGGATSGGGAAGSGAAGKGGSGGTAGGGAAGASSCATGTVTTNDAVVTLSETHQKITGFGASTAWDGTALSTAQADQVFSTTNGAGLSLLRVRIAPTGDTGAAEITDAKAAQTRGASVWATPWSPPAGSKSGGTVNGGSLNDGSRQSWAATLAAYPAKMKAQGVNLIAVSAQNEPDANVTSYEACTYSASALSAFISGYFAPAFSSAGVTGVKLMGPESQNWCGFPSYYSAINGNAAAWSALSIIATHEYGCSPSNPAGTAAIAATIQAAGKEFWETEIYDENSAVDSSITSGLVTAKLIHEAMTIANMNAWHYWWVRHDSTSGGYSNQGLINTTATKRLWVLGNYSRFVRPGFVRVGTSGKVPAGVTLSAYENPSDGTVVVVAINTNNSSTSLPVFISGAAPCTVTPWATSASDDLASKTPLPVSGARFTATLAAQSVTSFVGKP
jgi:glucuronoarabinoxylan endo-1,4-beta-xylanase